MCHQEGADEEEVEAWTHAESPPGLVLRPPRPLQAELCTDEEVGVQAPSFLVTVPAELWGGGGVNAPGQAGGNPRPRVAKLSRWPENGAAQDP